MKIELSEKQGGVELMDKKEYWIKIAMEDYGIILKAYAVAVVLLAQQYPESKHGPKSSWKKEKRKDNNKIIEELNESQSRFLKTCRETMKEVLN